MKNSNLSNQDIPSNLIKFFSLKKYAKSKINLLRNQELFFYNPSQCNDPFEMCVFNNINEGINYIPSPQKELIVRLLNDTKNFFIIIC